MAGTKFQPGDVVQHRTGGPQMIVENWNSTLEQYVCSWMDGKTKKDDNFSEHSLMLVDDKKAQDKGKFGAAIQAI